jgi:hypothetical protein
VRSLGRLGSQIRTGIDPGDRSDDSVDDRGDGPGDDRGDDLVDDGSDDAGAAMGAGATTPPGWADTGGRATACAAVPRVRGVCSPRRRARSVSRPHVVGVSVV